MIEDRLHIHIDGTPAEIFDYIDMMPNKFPVYKLMETKPFLFIRMMLTDGFAAARKVMKVDFTADELKMDEGDLFGPFTLTERTRPQTYIFQLQSLFFNCRTGYDIIQQNDHTELRFDLTAATPSTKEKIWWFMAKPVHRLFGNKVLLTIKENVEKAHSN